LRQIAKRLSLNKVQAHELGMVVAHIIKDVQTLEAWQARNPPRSRRVSRLKLIEKTMADLHSALAMRPDHLTALMPNATVDFLAAAFTQPTLSDLIGLDLTKSPAEKRAITEKKAGELLSSLIRVLHLPFAQLVEINRQNKVGRPRDYLRHHIIGELAKVAPGIIGREASVAGLGPFVRLCSGYLHCSWPQDQGAREAHP
jgi:hypothetical protein